MIGLDTNIVVRYIMQDDEVQSALATTAMEDSTPSKPRFISVVAIVEVAWVLARAYDVSNAMIASIIEQMLQADNLTIEFEQAVFGALIITKNEQAAFADALIGILGEQAGCTRTLTFDKRACRLSNFKLLV